MLHINGDEKKIKKDGLYIMLNRGGRRTEKTAASEHIIH
jgi:hypothetical protein